MLCDCQCMCWCTVQAELLELRSLVESLTRKNRHLAEELSEVNRAQDTAHTQLLGLQVRSGSLYKDVGTRAGCRAQLTVQLLGLQVRSSKLKRCRTWSGNTAWAAAASTKTSARMIEHTGWLLCCR
jgi:hypothetical protein